MRKESESMNLRRKSDSVKHNFTAVHDERGRHALSHQVAENYVAVKTFSVVRYECGLPISIPSVSPSKLFNAV